MVWRTSTRADLVGYPVKTKLGIVVASACAGSLAELDLRLLDSRVARQYRPLKVHIHALSIAGAVTAAGGADRKG